MCVYKKPHKNYHLSNFMRNFAPDFAFSMIHHAMVN